MGLDYITSGQGIEIAIFWTIGAIILGIGAIDTIYKEFYYGKRKNKADKDSK